MAGSACCAGIVLFGIHMTLQDIGRPGISVILMDVLVLLSPVLMALSLYVVLRQRRHPVPSGPTDTPVGRITIPWFAFGFAAMVALNSVFTRRHGGRASRTPMR